jgi:hypothetical protein
MSNRGILKESALSEEKLAVEPEKLSNIPCSIVTGNEKIAIVNHFLSETEAGREEETQIGVRFAIRNIWNSTISTIIFEAVFYDKEGNVIDTVKHKEVDLKPNTSRGIYLTCLTRETNIVKSYSIKIIRTTTADEEKVRICGYKVETTRTGEEEVKGTVKNISNVKTDAALIVNFHNYENENIGSKVVVFEDIESNNTRKFFITFKPVKGDTVKSCVLNIGEIADEQPSVEIIPARMNHCSC